MVQKHDKAL